jgi:hypothetical protein
MAKTTSKVAPLMPKATAVWLIENTSLTFQQIADSCDLHVLEVENLADSSLQGENPLLNGQLTQEEIDRCTADEKASLEFQDLSTPFLTKRKVAKYTPIAFRQDRPNGIAWIIKNHPTMSDATIAKLLATTLKTIKAIRDKTHSQSHIIKPTNPVILGLCTEEQLDAAVASIQKEAPSQPET